MRSSINLATEPFVDYRGFLLTAGILAGIALGGTLFLFIHGFTTWRETTTTQGKLRALESRRAALLSEQRKLENELRAPGTIEQLERVHFINQLIQRKSLSWTQLFFDLQERLPAQVRVLSLSPSVREDGRVQVELRVGARSAGAVIELLRALEQGRKFRDVVLHSQAEGRVGRHAVEARVTALYGQE